MNVAGNSAEAVAQAAEELARLAVQIDQSRAELARLQQDILQTEHRPRTSQLVQAIEQLVVSTLRAQTKAEEAAQALHTVSRAIERDVLTELPNRVLFQDRLVHAIVSARRREAKLAILFIDLDDFKHINDMLGHAIGDEMLKHAAQCLVAAIRGADTASRHGGDEFLILLDEISKASDAALVADKVIATLGAPYRTGEHVLQLNASIGISIYPNDAEDADTLVAQADAAMYAAKRTGRGGFLFHADMPAQDRPPSTRQSPLHRLAQYHSVFEHESQQAQMLEVNGHLLQAALIAQELQASAEHAHRQQTGYLAVLAHELRNPLTPLRTAAAMLGNIHDADSTMLPRLQSIIERQVMHMTRMVGDLLDVSRADTGKLRVERHAIDLADIVEDAVAACRPAMDKRGQRFKLSIPVGPLALSGDPVRLAQVFGNLLDNASRYTPEEGDIALSVAVIPDAIEITVSDNGIGISPEILPFVFNPFVQDVNATDFNGVGLGIGLTLVRELVEAHGGTVVVTSAGSGLGSAFVVTLPTTGLRTDAS